MPAVRCPRCEGLMVPEDFRASDKVYQAYDAWRCTCCGEILDDQIIENRFKMENGIPIRCGTPRSKRLDTLEEIV
jgi:hypothetical protein